MDRRRRTRLIAGLLLALGLAACDTAGDIEATRNSGDLRLAKTLFGAAETGTRQAPQPIGGYSNGCQAGGVALAETGPTWQAMRLSRGRNWAQPVTIDFVQDLSRFAATQPGWDGLYVGDLSQPRGGPMTSGHVSHQSGLDMDIWLRPADDLTLSVAERESISSISMRAQQGAFTNANWTPAHEAILRAAASDPRVSRIFIFPGAKISMCENATGDRSWLRKIRPWSGHHYHFHIRLACPRGARNCENQEPPPPGDGCAEALQWRADILDPPPPVPPDPDAPPPEPRGGNLLMAQMPAQCATVLASD